jgi:hypothetical protein
MKAHFEYHRKTIPCDFCREYQCRYFSRLYTFPLKDHGFFALRIFQLCKFASVETQFRTFSSKVLDRLLLTNTAIYRCDSSIRRDAEFHRYFKLVETFNREGRSPFLPTSGVHAISDNKSAER